MPQPAYTNAEIGAAVSTVAPTSYKSGMSTALPVVESHSGDKVKQLEKEIHLLTMSLHDKDAHLDRVRGKLLQ